MTPYYESERVKLYHGDCLAVMREMEAGCVDAVVTDPPYGIGKADWDNDVWPLLRGAATEAARLLDPKGICFWFGSVRYMPRLLDVTSAIPYRWQFIWYSSNNMQHGDLGYSKYGFALVLSHGKCWRNMQDLIARPLLPQASMGIEVAHPSPKPLAVMDYIVGKGTHTTDVILDPFMGSGTTGVACVKTGRRFIGIEIDAGYCEIARKRIVEAEAQGMLPLLEATP